MSPAVMATIRVPPGQAIDPVSRVKQKEIAASMRAKKRVGGTSTAVSQCTAIECPSAVGFITSRTDEQRTCQDLPLRSPGSIAAAILDVQCSFAQLLSNDGLPAAGPTRGSGFRRADGPDARAKAVVRNHGCLRHYMRLIALALIQINSGQLASAVVLDLGQSLGGQLAFCWCVVAKCPLSPNSKGKEKCHCRSNRFSRSSPVC